jgi:hypothetical protein
MKNKARQPLTASMPNCCLMGKPIKQKEKRFAKAKKLDSQSDFFTKKVEA